MPIGRRQLGTKLEVVTSSPSPSNCPLGHDYFCCRLCLLWVCLPIIGLIMGNITDSLGLRIEANNSFIQAAVYGFLLVGIASFAAPIISTVRVLLSLFVLPGKSVCLLYASSSCSHTTPQSLCFCKTNLVSPAHHIRSPRHLGCHHRCQRWHWQGICPLPRIEGLQPHSRFPNSVKARLPLRRHLL